MPLACKLCFVPDEGPRLEWKDIPRFATPEEFRAHWNAAHSNRHKRVWTGTEPSWPSILGEARNIDEGYVIYAGDVAHCSFEEIWCLRCSHKTTDPLAVLQRRCPQCGQIYTQQADDDLRPPTPAEVTDAAAEVPVDADGAPILQCMVEVSEDETIGLIARWICKISRHGGTVQVRGMVRLALGLGVQLGLLIARRRHAKERPKP